MNHVVARLLLACAVLVAAVGTVPNSVQARPSPSEPVTGWIEVTLQEIAERNVNPPRAARALALVSVAMERSCARGVPPINGAAAAVLGELFPDEAASFEARGLRLAGSRTEFERGRALAGPVIERGRSDGSGVAGPAPIAPAGPDFWRPTPPGFASPLEPHAGSWLTWNVSPAAVRPPPPPRPGDEAFERELEEVYEISQHLTDEQRRIALYWADGAGTVTSPGHWNQIALELVREARLPPFKAASAFAALNTAQADAFIAAWDTKFTYWSVRPVTVIRERIDPGWVPLIATPPFPAYVSGHSSASGAASTVLAALFPGHAARLHADAEEAAVSRLYGGIHFSTDNDVGLALGRTVGRAALQRDEMTTVSSPGHGAPSRGRSTDAPW